MVSGASVCTLLKVKAEPAELLETRRLFRPVAKDRSMDETPPPTAVALMLLTPFKRTPTESPEPPPVFAKIRLAVELAPLPVKLSPGFKVVLALTAPAVAERTPSNTSAVAVSILVVSG